MTIETIKKILAAHSVNYEIVSGPECGPAVIVNYLGGQYEPYSFEDGGFPYDITDISKMDFLAWLGY